MSAYQVFMEIEDFGKCFDTKELEDNIINAIEIELEMRVDLIEVY